ncbi:glycoside hydrolase family 16 protein [Blastococcus tunisiensis]|uniref:Glycosyl hydrolases family 16 n=1 Tax=Blastococcus tunisiensis TaxID=1798228 RepID=A0A1I2JEI6_9ACTN|nr:glycoside hydrolase family 16 protein [Blastococcus sp. DSM 46838]SFF51276.1 Glycosyl hydrolases family 16 [Blastococcus sp. DSM 46838]
MRRTAWALACIGPLLLAGCTAADPPSTVRPPGPASPPPAGYVEEFDTPVPLGQWPADGSAPAAYPDYLTYRDGTSGKYFPSEVLSVRNGVLDWWCHDSQAAAVLPFGYEGFQFGTYTVRMRTDRFPGYHIAFLLWPNDDQWTHELDGPEGETTATHPYPAVLQTTDPAITFAPARTSRVPYSWNDAEFHDYTWQWGPEFVAFFQDGVEVTRVTTNVPQEPMHPVLQVEFSNTLQDPEKPDPAFSGHVYVDRVSYDPSYTVPVPAP